MESVNRLRRRKRDKRDNVFSDDKESVEIGQGESVRTRQIRVKSRCP